MMATWVIRFSTWWNLECLEVCLKSATSLLGDIAAGELTALWGKKKLKVIFDSAWSAQQASVMINAVRHEDLSSDWNFKWAEMQIPQIEIVLPWWREKKKRVSILHSRPELFSFHINSTSCGWCCCQAYQMLANQEEKPAADCLNRWFQAENDRFYFFSMECKATKKLSEKAMLLKWAIML